MLKKLQAAPTVEVPWSGEVVASVRGLAPADITNLLVSVGEDLAGLFSLIEDLDKTKIDTKDATAAADQLMTIWPEIVSKVGVHTPDLLARLIATACDSPDDWEMVRDSYPFPLQFEILAEMARLTFNSPEGFRRFVGNVLLLVDLSGTLTSGSKKRPRIAPGPQSSGGGSTASSSASPS